MSEDWVDRAASISVDESPPASIERSDVVLVGAPAAAVAGHVALQAAIGTAERPVCLVATCVAPEKLMAYVSERAPTRPALGFVDATTDRPTPELREAAQAVENVAGSRDLLGLTTAVEDVCEAIAPAGEPTSVVVPAFDSLLGVAPTDRVVRVLSHVADQTDDGQVIIGLDYTRGSQETLETLKAHSDAMLWAEQGADGTVDLDVEPLRR